ncbi:MAG TPA: gamma-glutamyltransferase [Mariprofundaceae bacterium]|nr:gamma-glutamyltransferase [Mariprofundaceae bacterium]
MKRGVVAAGHAATAAAGAEILREGGNAVDAALAAITTSFTAEPVLTAAGGGGFMLLAQQHRQPRLFDGFARMPSGHASQATELKPIPIDFGDTLQTFHIGQASVGTPSLLAMLFAAHEQHGRMPLIETLTPAIQTARHGIRLNALQASFIRLLRPILTDTPASRSLHAPGGELLVEGDLFKNPDLANTLEFLAIEGIDDLYQGDMARSIVNACAPGGLLSMKDMCAEQVQIRTPLSTPMLSGMLLTNPPPSSGGILISYSLALLERLLDKPLPWPVRISEALRSASLLRQSGFDRQMHEFEFPPDNFDPQHLDREVQAILQRIEMPVPSRQEQANRHGSTSHISIIDKDGMAVSLTSSNGEGSGIVVPGTGIHLNNMLGEEDINPLGFHALPAGATLSSMMAPSIFMQHGMPRLILGSGGSNRLRGAILQVLFRHMIDGNNIEEAVHAPRLHNEGMELDTEPGMLNDEQKQGLESLGWNIREWSQQSVYFGGVHAIAMDSRGRMTACGDPRRGGAVAWG